MAGTWLQLGVDGRYPLIGGVSRLFLDGLQRHGLRGGVPEPALILYHLSIAAIALSIMAGGLVERMKFGAMIGFAVRWLLTVYTPICHWGWGGGWLQQMGVIDSAGGIVVQSPRWWARCC